LDRITTDVIVIGSGSAGLSAAIICRESNLDVFVCSKSGPGLGSCTVLSQGIFRSNRADYSPNIHKRDTLTAGSGLNEEERIDPFISESQSSIENLKMYGVNIKQMYSGYHSVSDRIGREGLSITRPMVAYAQSRGVKFLSPFFAWNVLKVEGKAQGVWGLCNGRPTIICAKAIILATGGAGALFYRTDNPQGITGDGYAMAYRAGSPLIDMEFVQFFPLATACAGKKGTFLPSFFAEVGELVNSNNEIIVDKYNIKKRPLAVAARDALSRAMALEVLNGYGIDGAIKLDLTYNDEKWKKAEQLYGLSYTEVTKKRFNRLLFKTSYLPVMPVSHFCMGGVTTNVNCKTKIEGLFACGEVVGGLHGANRLGGNALTETLVFGRRAGQNAILYAKENTEFSATIERLASNDFELLNKEYNAAKGKHPDYRTIKRKLQSTMWNNVGIIRSEKSLLYALDEITKYQQCPAKDLAAFLEIKNMLIVAEMIIKASLLRKESRGSHF
jgi:fumarate reductase (CoM/CoB) subunit A